MNIYSILTVASLFVFAGAVCQEPNVAIRDYRKEIDRTAVAEIMKSDWNKIVASGDFDISTVDGLFDEIELPGDYPRRKQRRVLTYNGTVAGFITYYRRDDKTSFIEILGVDPKYRKQGFGTLLLKDAYDYILHTTNLKNGTLAKTIDGGALKTNTTALSLYQNTAKAQIVKETERGVRLELILPVRSLKVLAASKLATTVTADQEKVLDPKLLELIKKCQTY